MLVRNFHSIHVLIYDFLRLNRELRFCSVHIWIDNGTDRNKISDFSYIRSRVSDIDHICAEVALVLELGG